MVALALADNTLSCLLGFLAAEAPMDEQSFPLMMELLNCMEGEKEDGCQDANVDLKYGTL